MRRLHLVVPLALGVIGLVWSSACRALPFAQTRPNVILLMADDMGWGDLGPGATTLTPHLDAMSANGLTFHRFYAAAPVCSPTRASVMTGKHPLRLGIAGANTGHLPHAERTLAEIASDAGYRTGFFGKWHLGTLTTDVVDSNRGGREKHRQHFTTPSEHGFHVWFATEAKVPDIVDCVVDLTETGRALRAAGLKIIDTILTSYTEIIANPAAYDDPAKRKAMEQIHTLLMGVLEARDKVLVKMNVAAENLEAVIALLPAMKSPTVNELHHGAGYAVETVVAKDTINVLIPDLKDAGATGIFEMPIAKIVH